MSGKWLADVQKLIASPDASLLHVVDESVFAQLLAIGGDTSDYSSTTDSLEAISDAITAISGGTANAFLAAVGGALDDAIATGAVSNAKTAMSYIKQIVGAVIALQADLDNGTDGLGALKALIDLLQIDTSAIIADLDNATDGLGALKILIDAIPTTMVGTNLAATEAVLGTITDTADETVDTATVVSLTRKNLEEAHEIERHLHNWERWFAIAQTNLSATRFAECLSVLALAADDPWTRLTPGAVNVWGSDVQIWGSDDAATVLPSGHQLVLDFHRLRLHDANDDKITYIMQIVSSPTSAADGRTAGTFTEFPLFIEKGDKSPAPIEVLYDRVTGTDGVWARIMTIDGTIASTLDVQFGVHGYPA